MYISSVKLLLKFADTSLEESISSRYMEVLGTDQHVSVVEGGYGYAVKQTQYLLLRNAELDIDNHFSLGFWLYSMNPGVYVDETSGVRKDIEMPLISFVPAGVSVNRNKGILSLREFCAEDGTNYLRVDADDESYYRFSNNYNANLWHYIWISYNGLENVFDFYLDGSKQTSVAVGDIPDIKESHLDVYINRSFQLKDLNRMNNNGYIDDIILFNETRHKRDMQKLIHRGVETFETTQYIYNKNYYGILFDDPSTLQINASIDDMSYLYISSNDGRVLRGSPLFWEARRNYSDSKEMQFLQEDVVGGSDAEEATNVDGFLRINNSVIRL